MPTAALQNANFIVGVDFGTTYSCVAFAPAQGGKNIAFKVVQEWPGKNADEVPSQIIYPHNVQQTYKWGYEATSNPRLRKNALSWFKVLLQHPNGVIPASSGSGPTSSPAETTVAKIKTLGATPQQVVTDYLCGIRGNIKKAIGQTYGEEFSETAKVKYVLTVPAIWTDSANAQMIRAAEKAGFGRHRADFTLVGEPEAAATYTLEQQGEFLKPGDTFVICDAGGGTVDLISYKLESKRPFRVCESVPGSGGLCGSIFLDQEFENFLRRKLGDDAINNMKVDDKEELMEYWTDRVKPNVGNEGNEEGFVLPARGLKDFKDTDDSVEVIDFEVLGERIYIIPEIIVDEIFKPIMDQIVQLVAGQVQNVKAKGDNVKAIMLVGGFGCSQQLFQTLQKAEFMGETIKVIRPADGRCAIAKGAIYKGLDGGFVAERRARRHYGFNSYRNYNMGETYPSGWEAHTAYDPASCSYRICDTMNWFIKKHQATTGEWVSGEFRNEFLQTNSVRNVTTTLYASDEDSPPQWSVYPAVHPICVMSMDFSNTPYHTLEITQNSGGIWQHIVRYKLNMRVREEVLEFTCTALDGTTELARVTADFESS